LFCCEGGAAVGYHRAGFDVIGVDIVPRPLYPFPFVQADAMLPPFDLSKFDAVHASPPCQRYSVATPKANIDDHPDLVAATRDVLGRSGIPWVIENVVGAPVDPTLILCGSMFGKHYRRHRLFESNVLLMAAGGCDHSLPVWGVWGDGGEETPGVRPSGHHRPGKAGTVRARELFGMPWASRHGLSEAIPPAYTEFIGEQLMAYV
jgi:DNA (cytosine-5)-methyltransferase 1